MTEVVSFAVQNEYREKVARMNQDLVQRYVPLMKARQRLIGQFNTEFANMMQPYETEMEQIEQEFIAGRPIPPAWSKASVEWQEKLQAHIESVFEQRYPGILQQVQDFPKAYEERLEASAAAVAIEKFVADGGTVEEYGDLEQAVLIGIFSRSGTLSEIVERHFKVLKAVQDEYEQAAHNTAEEQTPESLVVLDDKKRALQAAGQSFRDEFQAAGGKEDEAGSLFEQRMEEYYHSFPPINSPRPN